MSLSLIQQLSKLATLFVQIIIFGTRMRSAEDCIKIYSAWDTPPSVGVHCWCKCCSLLYYERVDICV